MWSLDAGKFRDNVFFNTLLVQVDIGVETE
jgi:hypothetical protein